MYVYMYEYLCMHVYIYALKSNINTHTHIQTINASKVSMCCLYARVVEFNMKKKNKIK